MPGKAHLVMNESQVDNEAGSFAKPPSSPTWLESEGCSQNKMIPESCNCGLTALSLQPRASLPTVLAKTILACDSYLDLFKTHGKLALKKALVRLPRERAPRLVEGPIGFP